MATNENRSFTAKVAFVTGAGSGIGRATALAFAREGANVVVADVSEQSDQKTARMIEELGGRALAVTCDVARVEDVRSALDKRSKPSDVLTSPLTMPVLRRRSEPLLTSEKRSGTGSSTSIFAVSSFA